MRDPGEWTPKGAGSTPLRPQASASLCNLETSGVDALLIVSEGTDYERRQKWASGPGLV